jgi:hypothetical protein
VAKERWEDTPTDFGSSDEEEEEGEITPPPLSSLCITPPLFSDIASQHVGATVDKRRSKQTQIGIRLSTDSPQQLHLSPVTYDQKRGPTFFPH